MDDFSIDPSTLDVHNYDTHWVNVTLRLLFDRCADTALPFYFPLQMVDEADVILIDTKDEEELAHRIDRGCPPPPSSSSPSSSSHSSACLIFLRTGQTHRHPEKLFVLSALLAVMTKRQQTFVLLTSWNEIWCTPFNVYGEGVSLVEPHRSVHQRAMALLDSHLLLAWFGKNVCLPHPKIHPLPLGPKKKPNGVWVGERMVKKEMWLSLQAHRPGWLYARGHKPQLVAMPLFEFTTTGNPAYLPHVGWRVGLMKVGGWMGG